MMRRTVLGVLLGQVASALSARTAAQDLISADEFWALYFGNRFLTLARTPKALTGEVRSDEVSGSMVDMVRPVATRQVQIPIEALRAYPFEDERFDIAAALAMPVEAAFLALTRAEYRYRDAAPFSPQRMQELAREAAAAQPGQSSVALTDVRRWLAERIEEPNALQDQVIAALIWFVGERRETGSAGELIRVLERSSHVVGAPEAQVLGSTAVDAAFNALWKINDKSCLPAVLDLMRRFDTTGRWKVAHLFERLLSQEHLLGARLLGDRYVDPAQWQRALSSARLLDPGAAARFDSSSLFWELRLLAARRMPSGNGTALQRLAADEVAPVRKAALKRLDDLGMP